MVQRSRRSFRRANCRSTMDSSSEKDMSTSSASSVSWSEDDASAAGARAGARAVSTPRTAKTADSAMCRVKVRDGLKLLQCTGCRYTSDRRANVTRHYRRIHGQLHVKKFRKCPCGDVFDTKWEFYKHCKGCNRSNRQSSYTVDHVYKMKETKATSKRKSGSKRRVANHDHQMNKGEESFDDGYKSKNDENSAPKNEDLMLTNLAHLPIKKRYTSGKRLLAEITNNSDAVQNIQQHHINRISIFFGKGDCAKFDQEFRAYLSNVNFNEFDATMKLRPLKSF